MALIMMHDYLGMWHTHPDLTPERKSNAERLLVAVNGLLAELERAGIQSRMNPKTGSVIAGETGGGFRPQDYHVGAKSSAHKTGQAVDIFDPFGSIGAYLQVRPNMLTRAGLWMENPYMTPTWCHLQTRPVASGKTIFNP
jgi:hypothetical protein